MRHRGHLTPDETIDLVDGRASDAVREHAASCVACRRQGELVAEAVALARTDEVPEPSPLFWDRLSARVGEAIRREARETESSGVAGWRRWLPVQALAATLALAVTAGVWLVRQPDVPRMAGPAAAAPEAWAVPVDDGAWDLVTGLASDLNVDGGEGDAVDPAPGSAERAVEHLSRDEQSELVRLLEAELTRHPS